MNNDCPVMAEAHSAASDLKPETTLHIDDHDVGDVMVLISEPQETAQIEPGVEHFVFTHPSGKMIGLNWEVPEGSPDWESCTLVGDEDGFHHALLTRESGEVRLLTRRQPGEPDDWEDRGPVSDIEVLETPPEPSPEVDVA